MSDFDLLQTPAGAWLAWWNGMLNRGGEGAQAWTGIVIRLRSSSARACR